MFLDIVHFVLWAAIGIGVAWAASNRVMRTVFEQGIIPDVMFGGFFAVFSAVVYGNLSGRAMPNTLDLLSLVVAFAGAAFALGVLRFVRKPLTSATA